MSTDLSVRAAQAVQHPTVRDLIERQRPAIERQLAGALDSGAFVRAVLSEVTKTPDLAQATPETLLGAIMLAAQLRLEIGRGLGEFWLTPRRDHGRMTCLPVIGYQGFIKLALRSEYVTSVTAFLVREGDVWRYGANSERGMFFDWEPADMDEKRPWTHAVAVATMRTGQPTFAYLTREAVELRRPSYWKSTPWATHPEEMARKTAVRALSKYLPKTADLGQAIDADDHKAVQVPGVDEPEIVAIDDDPLHMTAEEQAEIEADQ